MALKCDCGGDIRETIDNKDECIICGNDESNTIKGDDTMTKEHDFKIKRISGTATVIDNGKTFTTYRGFAKASGYEEAVHHSTELKEGEKVRLLAKGEHEYAGYGTVYVIETYKGVRHLIGHRGIKIDEPAQIPEQTYAEIAEPFGKQFRDAIREAYARGYADGFKQAKFDARMKTEWEDNVNPPTMDELMALGRSVLSETTQQKRDLIVEQAKADIESLKGRCRGVWYGSIDDLYHISDGSYSGSYALRAKFVINKHKRTVVVLMYGAFSNKVRSRGIAKCAPGDCFNEHIGKAIALRRALGLEVPDEYLNAPQPTEVRVGDVVEFTTHGEKKQRTVSEISSSRFEFTSNTWIDRDYVMKIIDDSREVSE